MKKLLSLIGVVSISVSVTSSSLLAISSNDTSYQEQNVLTLDNHKDDSSFQIDQLKNSYNILSENEKSDVAIEMSKLAKLNNNEIEKFLTNSSVNFIKEYKTTIANMFFLHTSFEKISNTLSVSTQELNIDWIMVNQFIDLDFGNSDDYNPLVSAYGPSDWWKFWEWGWQIDFPEGDINVMRVVNLVFSLYNGINFTPLENLIKSGKNFFDYLVNLDQHDDDKVSILYDLIIKTESDFKNSQVPFNEQLYSILEQFSSILKPFQNIKIQVIKAIIKFAIEEKLGISLEKISTDYFGYLNQALNILSITNKVLDIIKDTLPGIIWNFIVNAIKTISSEMIKADKNHNGVNLKFQQFIIPLGFETR